MKISKNRLALFLILTCLFILNNGCIKKQSFEVKSLTCEYLINPVGIDINQPRLSWKIWVAEEELAFSQKAWQIVASTSHEKLEKGEYDAWDSEKTESDQQHLVTWNGKKLAAGDRVFWKVKVWNSEDQESNWSRPAQFTIGPMDENDWHGQWIKYPYKEDEKYTEACFKKEFYLEELPEYAEVNIVVDGTHELYINGEKPDKRVLSPMLSSISRLRYVSYGITSLLKNGKNQIGVLVNYSWFSTPIQWISSDYVDDHEPAFMLQLLVGKRLMIASNTSWECKLGNRRFHANKPFVVLDSLQFNPFGGEKMEAKNPQGSDLFKDASESWLRAKKAQSPSKKVTAEMVEFDGIIDTIKPVKIIPFEYEKQSAWRIIFEQNFTGFLDLKLNGQPFAEVLILSSDVEEREVLYHQKSVLVLDKNGEGSFKHKFNFSAGRYVTVVGEIDKPQFNEVNALAVSNLRKQVGDFKCSNDLLNQIFDVDVWTYLANTVNTVTMDCPHRERRGYGMEGGMANIGVGLPVFESGALFTKWLEDWRDVQYPNGYFPHCSPRDDAGGGPLWSMAPVFLTYYAYLYYADHDLVRDTYPSIQKLMEYLHAQLQADETLPFYEDKNGLNGLGDWARPHPGEWPKPGVSLEAIGKRREMGVTDAAQHYNNCAYAWNLMLAVELSKIMDNDNDVKKYSKRLENLRQAIHRKYYDSANDVYIDTDQMRQAFPLFTDVPPERERAKVLKSFLDDISGKHPYFDTGNATHLLIRILTEKLERPDIVTRILLREEYPGYADLLINGATTWPEYWDFAKSNIHTTYTGVSYWFINGLCGIRPDPENPGFQKFILKPYFAEQLEWAKASFISPYGEILSQWEKKQNTLLYHCRVPPNTTAKLFLPLQTGSSLEVNNKQMESIEGIKITDEADGLVEFEVRSGYYQFKIKSNE